MSKQKVSLRIEEGEVELLKRKFRTDNQSEAIRLAIMQSLATEDLEKVKTLFPYIGKKPPRIGREACKPKWRISKCRLKFLDVKVWKIGVETGRFGYSENNSINHFVLERDVI